MKAGILLRHLAGYVAAIVTASFLVYAPATFMQMFIEASGQRAPGAEILAGNFLFLAIVGAAALGFLALPGWIILMVLGVRKRTQTKRWFLLGGALSTALPFAVVQIVGALWSTKRAWTDVYRSDLMLISKLVLGWVVVAAAGALAGWVYWAIAGRFSGSRRDGATDASSKEVGAST